MRTGEGGLGLRVLVSGGTRFIGRAVARRLNDLGHDVTVFHRSPESGRPPAGVRELFGDRRRLAEFATVLAGLEPDVVIDMIAMTEADASLATATLKGIAGLPRRGAPRRGPPPDHPVGTSQPTRRNGPDRVRLRVRGCGPGKCGSLCSVTGPGGPANCAGNPFRSFNPIRDGYRQTREARWF